MDMKWHPIVNGDLSGIQQQETILFTLFDEKQNENYVATGWILEDEGELVVRGVLLFRVPPASAGRMDGFTRTRMYL